jgi:hypothetical protein
MGSYLLKAQSPDFAGVFDSHVEDDVQLEVKKALSNPQVPESKALLPSLHQLVNFVDDLVARFKPLLE